MMESSWKLKQPKSLCSSFKASNKRGRPAQWDVIKGSDGKNISRSFSVYTPPNFCSTFSVVGETTAISAPLRIILAFHGYGGRPAQEIQKWQDVAEDLNAIIIAPMGSETIEANRLGWNAIECCGDPVLKDIDDLDFVRHGVMGIFLNQLGASSRGSSIGYNDNSDGRNVKQVNVIATGFSNGGFFTSLLGILDDRPEWLVGIVPTGGYQYDINAYSNTPALAIFMHHGGKDSVVNPNGCCIANEKQQKKGSKSSCMFDIGVKQETCQSAQSVYHLWSIINGCSSDSDHSDSRSIKEDGVKSVESECFVGKDCIEPTNFCVWTNEGHSWGGTFPGLEMMRPWMKDVFVRAEKKTFEQRDADELVKPHHRIRVGKSIFLSASSILLGIIALSVVYFYLKRLNCKRSAGKRKSSEDLQVFREEEMTVLRREDEIEKHTVSVP